MSSRAHSASGDRRRLRSQVSRQSLIAATIRSIASRGLEGTTLASVSEIAALSRGLVAFHFASKDSLIRAAIEATNAHYQASWQHHVRAPTLAGVRQLAAALAHDIAYGERHAELLSVWFAVWGESRGQAIYREIALPGDGRYVEEIAAMLPPERGPSRAARRPALATARAINAVLLGLWLNAHLAGPAGADWNAARESAAALLGALFPGHGEPLPSISIADFESTPQFDGSHRRGGMLD